MLTYSMPFAFSSYNYNYIEDAIRFITKEEAWLALMPSFFKTFSASNISRNDVRANEASRQSLCDTDIKISSGLEGSLPTGGAEETRQRGADEDHQKYFQAGYFSSTGEYVIYSKVNALQQAPDCSSS